MSEEENEKDGVTWPHPYDVLEAKKYSQTATKFFDEACDNSIQFRSTKITTTVDEQNKMMYIEDNGIGFGSLKAFNNYHQCYGPPVERGISRYGIGGKLFKGISDKRVLISVAKKNDHQPQRNIFYSYWDTSSRETTVKPLMQVFDFDGNMPSEVEQNIQDLGIGRLYKDFIENVGSSGTGTLILLPEIKDDEIKKQFKSYSRFKRKLCDSYFDRYHLLISNTETDISVSFINGKGRQDNHNVVGYDPFEKSLFSTKNSQSCSGALIVTGRRKNTEERLSHRGLHIYRDLIKIDTTSYKKLASRGSSVVVDFETSKSSHRLGTLFQAVQFRSSQDDTFKLAETKDSFSAPESFNLQLANELNVVMQTFDRAKERDVKNTLKKTGINVEFMHMEGGEERGSWFRDPASANGFIINSDSKMYEMLVNSNSKEVINVVQGLLNSLNAFHTDLTQTEQKRTMTLMMNQLGKFFEQHLTI